MKAKPWAILLMILTTLFTSTAQVLYKFGVSNLRISLPSLLTNYYLIGGLALYGLGALLMVFALPIIATSYIWVGLMSAYFFQEIINALRWFGIIAIVAGVVFVGIGSREAKHD